MVSFSSDARAAELEMRAILFVLVAFAFVDGTFDASERAFVRDTVDALVERRAAESFGGDESAKGDVLPRWRAHFYNAVSAIEYEIRASLTESVAVGESLGEYVASRLKLRCFELLHGLGAKNRPALLQLIDGVIRADGQVDPAEQHFRDEIERLLVAGSPHAPAHASHANRAPPVTVDEPRPLSLKTVDHPFFRSGEVAYIPDPARFAHQAAADIELMQRFEKRMWEQRAIGNGRLAKASSFAGFAGQDPFLDGWTQVSPTKRGARVEAIVFGDLHGCYSCLKAGLMQGEFFAKVEAYQKDPQRTPFPMVVFLGDYIDRGLRSYDGVLRGVLRVFLAAPDHVVVLRGNHEQYSAKGDRIESPMRPAEAIASIARFAPRALLEAHMRLFEVMPSSLALGPIFFVHGGIPRDETLRAKWSGLSTLNDPELRQQMAWSDPSDVDEVPDELQRSNMRFAFGKEQLRRFLHTVGCSTLVRGHERVVEGVRVVYKDPDAKLVSVFSSGGATNDDLPPQSNYREVTPMALLVRLDDAGARITPFPLEYAHYGDPRWNALAVNRRFV
ncbi:MAG TPA: metallophosphoesterase family protein [Byssovorax sp.]|jgi:hypothetical protein